MDAIEVRGMIQDDYAGVRSVDELTQREYIGSIWDQLSTVEKDTYLKSRRSEFKLNLQTGYCYVAAIKDEVVGFIVDNSKSISLHEKLTFELIDRKQAFLTIQ